ncbi:MAG: formylmethanofuran dehydrogenase subunit C [Ignisphaera sp.]|uniref:formylmethanofuran dehydrogenase n=1 Tax=Ignisphaera aggregans TaxID=334771 RepID=A0A7C4JJG3_9CREN
MSFTLRLKSTPTVLTDVRCISPDKFAGKRLEEIRNLKVLEGGVATTLDTLFDVEGPSTAPQDAKAIEINVENSLDKLCYVGYKMSNGKVVLKGGVGHFAGYKMKGGAIMIYGNVRNYLGAKMVNGTIEVYGNVGHRIGGKLQGEKAGKGMKGGTIHVHGNAGADVGWGAGGGTIIIDGNAGNFIGADMVGGVIIVKGNVGIYPGSRMIGGRIVVGGSTRAIFPSFYIDSVVPSLKVRGITFQKPFAIFIGDAVVFGKGMLQVSYEDNKHILDYYKYILEEVSA